MNDDPLTDPYDVIAPWYDLEHAEFADDLGMYRGFAEATGSPVLEVGCGSGRLLVPLAEAGYTITGVDRSQAMLNRCQAAVDDADISVAARVTLVQMDMTTFQLLQRDYRLAFVALGTFQHLPALSDQLAALRRLRAHVVSGATLVLDLAQAEPRRCAHLAESGAIAHIGTWRDEATQQFMTHSVAARGGPAPATFTLTHWYDIHPQGGPMSRFCIQTTIALITPTEIVLLLEATGWRLRQLYGDHEMGEWDESSPRLIVIAQAVE
jgi:SAM-dependent methyltransferase